MDSEQLKQYLQRIGTGAVVTADRETLYRLQEAHLKTVPYETLDIVAGRLSSLTAESIYRKVVTEHRGGYCFELNGLFAELLRAAGYQVKEYFARWHFGETEEVPRRRHRILHVTAVDGTEYIADAGVGCLCPLHPLEFVLDTHQERNGRPYRIVQAEGLGYAVQTQTAEGWVNFFSFVPDPHYPQDFDYPHFYCTFGEDSPFRKDIKMHRFTEYGRICVEVSAPGYILRETLPDGTLRDTPFAANALEEILQEHFGIPAGTL